MVPRGNDVDEAGAAEHDLIDRLGPGAVIELAGRAVSVLTLEQQLVLACVEATTVPVASLVQARDVAQLTLAADLDSKRARRLAEATGVAGALAEGIALAWNSFDLADKTDLSVWARRMGGSRRDRPGAEYASPSVGRVGLAQRVFGRRHSVPAGAPFGPGPAAPVPMPAVPPVPAAPAAAPASAVVTSSARSTLPPTPSNGTGRTHRSPRS